MNGPNMHLIRRNGVYYFRYVLPTTLKAKFQASEIKFTLNTLNKKYAKELAAQCFVRCLALAGQGITSLSEATKYVKATQLLMDQLTPLITLLTRSDTESLQQAFRVLNANNFPVYLKVPGLNDFAYYASKLTQGAYYPIRLDAHPEAVIVPYFDRQVDLGSASLDDGTLITFHNPRPVHLHQLQVKDLPEEMVAQLRAIGPAVAPAQPKVPDSPLLGTEFSRLERLKRALGALRPTTDICRPFKELKAPSWAPKTVDEYQSVLDLFFEIVGDMPVLTLTNEDYDKFILTIRKIPPNR